MDDHRVGASRDLNDDLVLRSRPGIVFRQLCPQTAGLDPHGRIEARIEISRATEDLGCDLILLDRTSLLIHRMARQILKQMAQRLRAAEYVTLDDSANFGEERFPQRGGNACYRHETYFNISSNQLQSQSLHEI